MVDVSAIARALVRGVRSRKYKADCTSSYLGTKALRGPWVVPMAIRKRLSAVRFANLSLEMTLLMR